MLSPDSRTVAFDLLRPPAGHELDFALLTTYTLDLEALLALPLGLVARSDNGLEELLADPLLLLEGLRRAGERIHVFVDRAGIAIPRTRRELYALLEPSVHPVRAPGRGAFHPKVWVLRFMSENGAPLIRVAVLSRNLTFDRSWDIAFATEASPMPRQRSAGSRPLAEFVRGLPELCAEPPNPSGGRQDTGAGRRGLTHPFPGSRRVFRRPGSVPRPRHGQETGLGQALAADFGRLRHSGRRSVHREHGPGYCRRDGHRRTDSREHP